MGDGGRRGRGVFFFQYQLLELVLSQNQAVVQRHFVNSDIIFFFFFFFSLLQPHAPGSLMELDSKEELFLKAAADRPVTLALPFLPADPSGVALAER